MLRDVTIFTLHCEFTSTWRIMIGDKNVPSLLEKIKYVFLCLIVDAP